MGILSSILPTTSSSAQHGQTAKPLVNVADRAVQNAVQSGSAAVVQVGASNPRRTASYGESRNVDSTFEKKRTEDETKTAKEKEKSTTQKSVDVSA